MIRVAIIGVGHWGPNIIKNLHNNIESSVICVADKDEKRLQRVKDKYPDIKVTPDAEGTIRNKEIDAVVIATPTVTHYELTKLAIEAGKHVLVEKPITNNFKQAQELQKISKVSGKVLMVGHIFLYNSAVQWIKKYLTEDKVGQLYYLSMIRTNLGPIRTDVHVAWDLIAHDISIANYWLNTRPISVSAIGGNWINKGIEDAVFATLRYPNNILVRIDASWIAPTKVRQISVIGEQQMLTFDDTNIEEPVRIYDKGISQESSSVPFIDNLTKFRAGIRKGATTIPAVPYSEPLHSECLHFIECINSGKSPSTSVEQGMEVVRVLEIISDSMKNGGREISLD